MEKGSFTLCGSTFKGPMHICAFFDSKDEQYDILLPWLKEGIERDETVLTILSGDSHQDHCSRLEHADIPVRDAVKREQLRIVASEDSYVHGGYFAAERMLGIVGQALDEAEKGSYKGFRGYGDMEWALNNLPGTDELMEYEARLNALVPRHQCSVLCCYDLNKFNGRAIADILATHPYVILNGRIHVNPHFVEPMEFLATLIKRPRRSLTIDRR